MKKPLKTVLAAVAGLVLGVVVTTGVCWWRQPAPAPVVKSVECSRLPKTVFDRGEFVGSRVVVAFPLPLVPMNDPLVWRFRPGTAALDTYRIHFRHPPQAFIPGHPVVVEATVEKIEYDMELRPSGVPGVLVLSDAVPLAP